MTLPTPRVLAGVALSIFVLGLALAVSDAGAAARGSAAAPASHRGPVPMAHPPVGVLVDPYTRAAAACRGLDPLLLVAIHDVETERDVRGRTSSAGAVGPMQFLPDTWMTYGVDANRDGRVDAWNLDDALAGATHLLCANGANESATRPSAIWNYNHSWSYVRRVLARLDALHAARTS